MYMRFVIFLIESHKGVWWMPRHTKAMKDVAWRRYTSGRCRATFDPEVSEWGNPLCLQSIFPYGKERTQGSETSQYLEEEKAIAIP